MRNLLDCSTMPPARTLLILLAATAVAPAAFAQDIVVRPGDTLWGLAQRHGTTVDALREVNGLTEDTLRPGMSLHLPSGSTPSPTSYTVQVGDTLFDIAVAFDLSVDDLIAINDLDGTVIRPGQVLQLSPQSDLAPLVITVAPGDSLWGIARQFDTTPDAIAQTNGLSASATLHPGDRLVIPGRYAGGAVDQGGATTPSITVAPGDSLWAIARRYNTTVAALMSANGLRDTELEAGQVLRVVPGSDLVRAGMASPQSGVSAAMVWPVVGQITSRFGYRRLRIGGSNMHYGLDIDGVTGDPIRAAVRGVVTYAGWNGGYGNLVVVEADGTEYYYAHASKILVRTGDLVRTGQVIALIGNTGRSTGSHLHFEIRVDGTPVDPLPVLERSAAR